jgi:hypothetical protein
VADETRLIFGGNCFRWLLVIFFVVISVYATENKKNHQKLSDPTFNSYAQTAGNIIALVLAGFS